MRRKQYFLKQENCNSWNKEITISNK